MYASQTKTLIQTSKLCLASVLDKIDLQKAKEHNQRLNEEILALRSRVRSLDSEKKMLGEMVSVWVRVLHTDTINGKVKK